MEKNIKELYIKSIFEKLAYAFPSITTDEIIDNFGKKIYQDLRNDLQRELESVNKEACIDYAYNLVLNRTYEGYRSEIDTVYGQLESILYVKIHPAPDEWDRTFNVDFYIQVANKYIGLQIKPISSGQSLNQYQWIKMHEVNHGKFRTKFGGKVFFIYSVKAGKKKKIYNVEVIDEIKREIERLKN